MGLAHGEPFFTVCTGGHTAKQKIYFAVRVEVTHGEIIHLYGAVNEIFAVCASFGTRRSAIRRRFCSPSGLIALTTNMVAVCLSTFAMCHRHTAKRAIPVVTVLMTGYIARENSCSTNN